MDGHPTTATQSHPAQLFMDFIAAVLAPMFLPCCEGNVEHARMLALETARGYGRNSLRDLIGVARIVAFDLGALSALGQSLAADEIPITLALRLRQNALGCDRVSERTRKQLETTAPKHAESVPTESVPTESGPLEPAAPPEVTEDERIHRTVLANAMFDVARQLIAEAAHVPTAQAREASVRANILTEAARTLLVGIPAPETPLPLSVTASLPVA